MNIDLIKDLKEWFDKTDLIELGYRDGNKRVGFIKKGEFSNKKISSDLKSITAEEIGMWSFSKKGKKINIKEGDAIKKGNILGYITLKDRVKEVVSPYNGTIKVICVEENSIVEWGQILFIIE